MSIIDGLLGKLKKDVVDKVAEAIKNEVKDAKDAAADFGSGEAPVGYVIPGGVPNGYVVGSGSSAPSAPEHDRGWYRTVPQEECQYNYNGTFIEYFDMIFREDFPEYNVKFTVVEEGRRYLYTFTKHGPALVVELMTEKSAADKLRRECMKTGVPYLRFYFDHEGWWNTRAYVKERVKKALKI